MEFHINKGSRLPKLKLVLINDGRNDYHKFHEKIQDAQITFTMTDVVTGVKKIAKRVATTEQVESENCVGPEFYLVYNFDEKDTNKPGKYVGQFEITFNDLDDNEFGFPIPINLIVPIREELFINVLEGSIRK